MKKIIIALTVVAVSFWGCGDDEDDVCYDLTVSALDASIVWSDAMDADVGEKEACNKYVDVYRELVDAGCLTAAQADIDNKQATCDAY